MHASGSVIRTFVERTRQYIDNPDFDAKYDDDYLVRHLMSPATIDVVSRVNMMSDTPVLVRHSVSLVRDQEFYLLPPNVGQVYRMAVLDDNGRVTKEWRPRGEFNPRGPGWKIEGNTLVVRPFPGLGEDVDIWYVPTGEMNAHLSVANVGILVEVDGEVVQLELANPEASPTSEVALGGLDRRPNAYAGMMVRVLGPAVHEERVIASHDVEGGTAGTVNVRVPFVANPATEPEEDGVTYEVLPVIAEPFIEAIAASAAMKAGTGLKVSQVHMSNLAVQYRMAIKTAHDISANVQARLGKAFDRQTVDNPDWKWSRLW
jgi:hypothetical protein